MTMKTQTEKQDTALSRRSPAGAQAGAPSYLPPPDEQPGLADYAPSSFNPLI